MEMAAARDQLSQKNQKIAGELTLRTLDRQAERCQKNIDHKQQTQTTFDILSTHRVPIRVASTRPELSRIKVRQTKVLVAI